MVKYNLTLNHLDFNEDTLDLSTLDFNCVI